MRVFKKRSDRRGFKPTRKLASGKRQVGEMSNYFRKGIMALEKKGGRDNVHA